MTIAQNAMIIVIGWQTYTIARETMSPSASAAQLGLIGLLQFVPLFVTTPVTGWVADRFRPPLDRPGDGVAAGALCVGARSVHL